MLENQHKFTNDNRLEVDFLSSLAKIYKDIGAQDKFLKYTLLCNKRQREISNYQIANDFGLFHNARLKDRVSPDFKIHTPKTSAVPIFILGMPRSGTTLVEQIISNHPSIAHGGELTFLVEAYKQFCGLSNYSQKACESTRRYYFKCSNKRHKGRQYLTDKAPFNFMLIGLIKRAIPEAKIVHVVRNPKDVCWSNFRTIFKTGSVSYSNDIDDVVSYYNQYVDIMEYWYQRYPNGIYTLQYESLVKEVRQESQHLLAYLGLPWDPSCLNFEANPNPIKTASQLQVRQSLQNMNDEWKSFEAFLAKPFEHLKIPKFWKQF